MWPLWCKPWKEVDQPSGRKWCKKGKGTLSSLSPSEKVQTGGIGWGPLPGHHVPSPSVAAVETTLLQTFGKEERKEKRKP